jgi:hypothetical protein
MYEIIAAQGKSKDQNYDSYINRSRHAPHGGELNLDLTCSPFSICFLSN